MGSVKYIQVDQRGNSQRIDNYLLTLLKNVPKSHIYKLIRSGQVRLNKGRCKPHSRLSQDDIIRLPPIRQDHVQPNKLIPSHLQEQLEKSIVFENADIVVINKPSGIAVHAGTGIDFGIIEILRAARNDKNVELVHRIDRETSGCLLISKNRETLEYLHQQFLERTVTKQYLTFIQGVLPSKIHQVSLPLKKHVLQGGQHLVKVDEAGKAALTLFKVINIFSLGSLVTATIKTGRTHQIRVHASHSGFPIAGDSKYGDKQFNKQCKLAGLKQLFLHAERVKFKLLGYKKPLEVITPMPLMLKKFLTQMK